MKKNKIAAILGVFTAFLLVSVCFSAYIQKWYTGKKYTIAWDAVTSYSTGHAIPEGRTIEYKIYLSNFETDPNKINPIELGTTQKTNFIVELPEFNKYVVGLQTICKNQDNYLLSDIGWADNVKSVSNGVTFGLHYFISKPPFFTIIE
jgi:hypothetical protein